MPGQGHVKKLPCGRLHYCGSQRCPHAVHCAAAAGGEAPGWAQKGRAGQAPPGAVPPYLPPPADLVYLYDGSLPGFYCCVFASVYDKQLPAAITPAGQAQPSLYQQRLIQTEPDKAARVERSIPEKLGGRGQELVQTCFLCNLEDKEMALLRFLLLGYKVGRNAPVMLGHPDVAPLLKAEKHMGGEAHLLKGFIRFSDYGGVLAATISPKNFVLPFLVSHFCLRYPNEHFMIFDKVHKAALVHENGQSRIIPLEGIEFPEADETEEAYRALWKHFYNTVAIEARTNHKCRRTHMPKRYWENMLEVQHLL